MIRAIEALLLAGGVAVQLFCCVGIWRMRSAYDQLHFLSPASVIGPALIAAAVVIEGTTWQLALKAVTVALLLAATGPVVTRVLARAFRVRQAGTAGLLPGERAEPPPREPEGGLPQPDGRAS